MYVFECFIACFDPLGVLYLSVCVCVCVCVGGGGGIFKKKAGEKAGSMRREGEERGRRNGRSQDPSGWRKKVDEEC